MIKKYGLFILGMLIPFFFTKFPQPYFAIGIVLIPTVLAIFFWNRLRPLAVGLISGVGLMAALVLIGFLFIGLFQIIFGFLYPKSKYPDQEKVITKLEQYKTEYDIYPKDLKVIGFNVDEHVVLYYPKESSFCLCYDYPLAHIGGTCFDSRVGHGTDTCFDPKVHNKGH